MTFCSRPRVVRRQRGPGDREATGRRPRRPRRHREPRKLPAQLEVRAPQSHHEREDFPGEHVLPAVRDRQPAEPRTEVVGNRDTGSGHVQVALLSDVDGREDDGGRGAQPGGDGRAAAEDLRAVLRLRVEEPVLFARHAHPVRAVRHEPEAGARADREVRRVQYLNKLVGDCNFCTIKVIFIL